MMTPELFGNPKKQTKELIESFPLDGVEQGFEPKLPFNTHWIQDHRNHRALLDCFWEHIRPTESLVFFYAKQVPLVEDTGRRVLIGAGRVQTIHGLTEYDYEGLTEDKIRSLIWERMVIHSIRPNFKDGFLLPYQEGLDKSDEGRNFDPAEIVAFAPEDRFTEFSYATEHVGNDAAISALLSCRAALLRATELFSFSSHRQEQWIDKELGRLWRKRGPFPGLGAVLTATGVPMGHFIAQALVDEVGEDADPWPAWLKALQDPAAKLPADLVRHLDDTIAKSWLGLSEQRRAFLQLLSRIDLTADQAGVLAIPEERREQGIAQGTNSDELFHTQPEFRKLVNQKLPQSHKIKDSIKRPNPEEYQVVFAIVSDAEGEKLTIPFFSRLNLRAAVRRLGGYGYRVAIAKIKVNQDRGKLKRYDAT